MQQQEELKGTIDRFLFQNSDNGFSIFILQLNNKDSITIKGHFANAQPGQEVSLYGNWIFHPKFGRQFEAFKCITILPTSLAGLKRYLGSGMIKGIGKTYAEKLVNHFGINILEVIEKYPEQLKQVPGIGVKRIEQIANSWKDQKEISNIMVFLQEKEISTAYATKIYKKYGQNSIAVLLENPYRLADEIWGIGFKIADKIAINLGLTKDSLKRIKAGIVFAITSELSNGHLYIELQDLKQKTCSLLEIELPNTDQLVKKALHELHDENKIKLITQEDKHYITLSQYYSAEKSVATRIQALLKKESNNKFDLDATYKYLLNDTTGIQLNEDQQRGIMAALQNKITIITGGPGTGKTTLIKKLLNILEENKVNYKLAAPTGRAAKRIIEGTGRNALTIHRLLEFDFNIMSFNHNERNTLKLDFLILDEASMIDIFLANSILKALPIHAHLILIGDIDQLPSVGAGNFLNDLIKSKQITCIQLKEIFRQAQNSLIIVNAHKINNGEFPVSFLPDAKRDFIFIKEEMPENVTTHLKKIFFETLKTYYIKPEQAIVLVPMNRGTVGAHKLNHDLQNILNPTQKSGLNIEISYSGYNFKIGDRVMQISNNYEKLVFNGDMGIIEDINMEDKIIFVRYYERVIEYAYDELNELMLAYAISIHKSQGSEFSAVIIPIFTQHFTLLQRNLLYTAITRAKKLCIFIGQVKAVAMAIKNNKSINRKTFLKEFLTQDLQCR